MTTVSIPTLAYIGLKKTFTFIHEAPAVETT